MTSTGVSLFAISRISGRPADVQHSLSADVACDTLRRVDEHEQRKDEVGRQLADALYAEIPLAGSASRRLLLAARRSAHGGREVDTAKLLTVLQTKLAYRFAHAYAEAYNTYQRSLVQLTDTLELQQRLECETLSEVASDRDFQIGVFWSSPDFLKQLREQLERKTLSQSPSMLQAVLRYATRFSSKPTPFSRFARVAAVDFASAADGRTERASVAQLVGSDHLVSRVYLNRGLFDAFWRIAATDPCVRERLRYRLNTSATDKDGSLVFVALEGGAERLLSVQQGAVLRRLVPIVTDRALTYSEIRELLSSHLQQSLLGAIDAYLDRLVDMNLLVAEAPVDANDPLWHESLHRWLKSEGMSTDQLTLSALDSINREARRLADCGPQEASSAVGTIETTLRDYLKAVGQTVHLPHGMVAYEDCSTTARLSVDLSVEVRQVFALLQETARVALAVSPALDEQERLREFYRREFADSSLTSLMTFADRIFRSHFSQYLFAEQANAKGQPSVQLNELQSMFNCATVLSRAEARRNIVEVLLDTLNGRDNHATCDLSYETLAQLVVGLRCSRDADSTSIAVQFARQEGKLYAVAQGFGLAGGNGKMASRFLNMLPAEERLKIQSFNSSRNDFLSAEIVHDVDFNANLHPALTASEIVYPTRVGCNTTTNQLLVRDLYVGPDEDDDCVLSLYHLDRRRRVRPLDLGFLNPMMRQPFFRLLARFQPPSAGALPIESALLEYHRQKANGRVEVTFSPRVTIGGCIVIARARWRVPASLLPAREAGDSELVFMRRMDRWRTGHGIPRRAFVRAFVPPAEQQRLPAPVRRRAYRDQKPQLIEFGSMAMLGLLGRLGRLSEQTVVLFEEVLPDQEDYLQTEDGRFAYELFLQFDGIHAGT